MSKRFFLSLLLAIFGTLLVAGPMTPAPIAPPPTVKKILHYTETKGYDHNTRTQSSDMFNDIAALLTAVDSNCLWLVIDDNDGSEFSNLANLQTFHLVVFSNTSGNSGLDATQRSNFETYIAGGGSYLGIHAATDTYRHSSCNGGSKGDWDWYAEEVAGASVRQSPNHTSNNKVEDITHTNASTLPPGNTLLGDFTTNLGAYFGEIPAVWNKQEEFYYWHPLNNGQGGYISPNGFIPFLNVQSTGSNFYDQERRAAWYRGLPGGGCAYGVSLGHDRKNFTGGSMNGSSPDSLFRHLILCIVANPTCGAPNLAADPNELIREIAPTLATAGSNLMYFVPEDRYVQLKAFTEPAQKLIRGAELYSLGGSVVYETEFTWSGEGDIRVDLPNYLPRGTYYLKLIGGQRSIKVIL